ncbi:MAG TPA: cysteine dioxygenase family protein [Mycobacteriales bacterium]|jgi:predicted metal-dependent enzyme (double-stranded beta helix superfamily)|nr:cysteine dioxygenase family protein [Mycobacteriales bacterium]
MTSLAMSRFADRLTALADRDRGVERLAADAADLLREVLCLEHLLGPAEREPDPRHYRQHILHVDPAGRFSVVALVWLPGQGTPIHDHVAWCATGVLEGCELEQRFEVATGCHRFALRRSDSAVNEFGAVSVLPPGHDIHEVRCHSGHRAISLHVYGADILRLGNSIHVRYDRRVVLPVSG